MDFSVTAGQRKRKKKQLLWPYSRNEKAVEHKDDSDTKYNWSILKGP